MFETAWAPYALDRPALVYSASKTYTSLAIGFLADEGRLGLDASAGDLLGEPNPHGITVRHLLTMNTGHDSAQIGHRRRPARARTRAARARAGHVLRHNSPATHALSAIVTAVTGEPLTPTCGPGTRPARHRRPLDSSVGASTGASGYHLTVGDLARTVMLGAGGVAGRQVAPAWAASTAQRRGR